ncbi:N-6 DNA methylase [Comamonas testosteroni]|jgi:N12 class adenine-specific DNA methylase|uniref:Eco57I restriction-modification methylase domain-containing protein n=1 Tax=Comamonas testosteroni TaxID=285 RepID=UPI0026EEFC89|nr:N-6 DNA methylase [Comamonas testosteroni]
MQLDMFGATSEEAVFPSGPPVLTMEGAWVSPEVIALNDALKSGSIIQVIAILNRLKTPAASVVLSSSGFATRGFSGRAAMMKHVQLDLLAACRLKMTGHELREHRDALQRSTEQAPSVDRNQAATDYPKSTTTGVIENANPLQAGAVRRDNSAEDRNDGSNGGGNSESLGHELGAPRDVAPGQAAVPEGFDAADRYGKGHLVRGDGPDPSVIDRNSGDALSADGAPVGQPGIVEAAQLRTAVPAPAAAQKDDPKVIYARFEDEWAKVISPDGSFSTSRQYPLKITMNGKERLFGASRASNQGPFFLTTLRQTGIGPEFNYYKLDSDGVLEREGRKYLGGLPAAERDKLMTAFVSIFSADIHVAQSREKAILAAPFPSVTVAATPLQSEEVAQAVAKTNARAKLEKIYVTRMSDAQLLQALELFTDKAMLQAVQLQIDSRARSAQAAEQAQSAQLQSEALNKVRSIKQGGQERFGERIDHVIRPEDGIGEGSLLEKYQDNINAIHVLRTLDSENRNATPSELATLARYVGWGGLKGVFDPENKAWAKQYLELKSSLTPDEWVAARRSQLDAFYTAPVVVNAMYAGLERMGFTGGRLIDPSIGSGNFVGMMPEHMRSASSVHGVELDHLTSRIASALYPTARIAKATGFQDYKAPAGHFDLVVGNPPFGSQQVVDDVGSAFSGWSIHNYFFAKSIELTRPGGLMTMVVSHNFLDKLDPHVRQWISRRAELVSGVRLPEDAFKANANTEVVTDILVFKRIDNTIALGRDERPDWLETTDTDLVNAKSGETAALSINNYFLNNPQNVLGSHSATGSMYRPNAYTVLPDRSKGSLKEQLDRWVESLPQGIYLQAERMPDVEVSAADSEIPAHVKEGSFFLRETPTGHKVWQRLPDLNDVQRAVPWEVPNERAAERMVGMIRIREALRHQMLYERSKNSTTEQIEGGRRELNRVYDAFKSKFGFLNDAVNRRIFLDDTESPLVQALEFDYEKAITANYAQEHGVDPRPSRAVKADIFSRRVLFPPGELELVDTAKDALVHSLNHRGRVDMEYMKQAYGKEEAAIIAELGDLIYFDPTAEKLVTADEYLSGDVKTKLQDAQSAAKDVRELERNVTALQAVIPADKMPSEIHASIGASWIPANYYVEFAQEISGSSPSFTYVRSTGQWVTTGKGAVDFTKNHSDFGTPKMGAIDIFSSVMNSRAPEVKKPETVDGSVRYVTDEEQTEAARQAMEKIRAHWDSWLWKNPERATVLAGIYNERFNRRVERTFDGAHLSFPGMNPGIELLGHQKNAVWRGLQDRAILLDHVVGAGKTFESIALLMEMRRLGICNKPLLAVPNHLTLQWRSDFYKLYPGANVLAATPQDFDKENREKLFAKIATGSWDAVIIGHSSLKKLPLPPGVELDIMQEQLDEVSNAIEDMKRERGDRHIVRDMEKIKSNLEAKMKKLQDKAGEKSKVVDLADLGIDALEIDEAHIFKNLAFNTQMNRVAGLGNPAGSGQAFDLFVKTRWLQKTYGNEVPLIHATGTPVSNSLAEMFTVQRYLQYDRLKENGLHLFDAWAKQYGDVTNVYEVAPSGTGYRLSQRFAKFKNLGSLMGEYRSFADVVTLQDLKEQEIARGKVFPVPKVAGGKPKNVVVPRSKLQEAFFGVPELDRGEAGQIRFEQVLDPEMPLRIVRLDDGQFEVQQQEGNTLRRGYKRYETEGEAAYMTAMASITPKMKIDPHSIIGQFENLRELTRSTKGKINALSLTGLANKAGLDYRLIDPAAPDDPNSKINHAIDNMMDLWTKWETDKGTQLVFCDLSVPLSAKAKMASKDKRIFVRDEAGALTHKTGTLHTKKDFEHLPYFVVASGRKNDRSFSIFDPSTGQLMKEGLDSKQEAHEFFSRLVEQDGGLDQWTEMRERSLPIGEDEIAEYKSEKSLDVDGDTSDTELSLTDIEGARNVAGFSVYDDMKAKLIARGVPEKEIEFIHDHDTPQAKDALFKRVNAGDVRFMFGSTAKMGAGTNVQMLIVGLHHIDAPYRPSDLEQREGRGIRRGNKLYERDPENFELGIFRYATSQTYDTRRWQLLEHKASGIEQLRNYTVGVNEIEDVATEASNSADMKAASSGNPLILKETQLGTEVKKLRNLERAHMDSQFSLQSRLNSYRNFAEKSGPKELAKLEQLMKDRDQALSLGSVKGVPLQTKEDVTEALTGINSHITTLGTARAITYRGMEFRFNFDERNQGYLIGMPDGEIKPMATFSCSGIITRMENFCSGVEDDIASVRRRVAKAETEVVGLQELVDKPFKQSEELKSAIAEHAKVQRALRKSNSLAAVKPEEAAEFKAAVEVQKILLRAMGFGDAVLQIEAEEKQEISLEPGSMIGLVVNATPSPASILADGLFVGQIMTIDGDLVVQKVNREGKTQAHSLQALGESGKDLQTGEIVEIAYRSGTPLLSRNLKSLGLD